MGRSSKQKGYRGEILLRDYLRKAGWTSDRVPMSGAVAGLPGDVRGTKGNLSVLFEMKFRREEFKQVYALYDEHRKNAQDDVFSVALPGAEKLCLNMSTSLDAVFDGADYYNLAENHILYPKYKRTFAKMKKMQEWVKESDILVIKNNGKPLLFLRYR